MAASTGVLVKAGGALTAATVMVKVCFASGVSPFVAVRTTWCAPACSYPGVPERTLPSKVSHDGSSVAVTVGIGFPTARTV